VGSENVYPHQRQLVEEVMNCRLFSHYGHCERACLAGECEHGNYYHIFWQYGYTELINAKGEHSILEDEPAEIVATAFDNYAMPLIRYKTMDIACNTNEICDRHKNYKLIKNVKGRLQEVLVTSTGRYISMTSINMHSKVFDSVKQFQFYQDTPNACIFNIVKKPLYTVKDEENIIIELKKKLGNDIELKLKYVDEIPRTISGKYRFLIQKLPIIFTEDVYND
jgi:phenylacetate-CoA ligase